LLFEILQMHLKWEANKNLFAWCSREHTAGAGSQHVNNEMRNIE
jgi:hypothetical protein